MLISGLLGGSIGGLFGQDFAENVQKQYKQETPCDDIHKLRSDVAW